MSNTSPSAPDVTQVSTAAAADRLRGSRVLLVGLGNIGSYLAVLLAPLVSFVRLVDRDKVESHNRMNQFYGPEHVEAYKVDVTAQRLQQLRPELTVERRRSDLQDLPWGDFEDIDVALSGLDSLRARLALAEKLYPLQIPYIDGAVGDPLLIRVQVLLAGHACLECSWDASHYRQLSAEYPCIPGGVTDGLRTISPSCAGAVTAGVMVAQFIKLFGSDPPTESYEINGDLLSGRSIKAWRRKNPNCRFTHPARPHVCELATDFERATVGDLLVTANELAPVGQLEFRRGILAADLFGGGRFATLKQLTTRRDQPLQEFGLTPLDHVILHYGESQQTHIRLQRSVTREPAEAGHDEQ